MSSSSPVRVSARSAAGPGTNDCSDLTVREAVTSELSALPFLGELTCSTSTAVAGSIEELIFTYTVGQSGIADSGWLKLCFRFYSDWDLQTTDAQGRDFASARVTARSLVGHASEGAVATVQQLKIRYDVKGGERPFQKALLIHVVDGYLRPGDTIEIRLGDRRFGGPGTRVQTFVEDEFEFHLFVDPLGTSRMARAALSRLAIVPGPPARVEAYGPRLLRFDSATADLRVHLQDRWGNACRDVSAGARARVGGVDVASADFPSQGWAAVTLTVPAEHRCVDIVAHTATGALENARCYLDVIDEFPSPRALFADLHVHSNDTVGTQNTPWNLSYGRDIGALDVIGYTANDFQITDDVWADVVAACRDINEDGRLVCYPGVEWCGTAGVGGDHNVVFLRDDTTLARSLEWHLGMTASAPIPQNWPITQLYAAYDKDPDSYLLIPHVGGRRAILDWHHPQLERLIEVHSAWGTSPWFFEDAMARGLRLGASAASDEHRGRPGGGAPGANIFGGHGGLTGVLAPELTREDVGRTLRARRTWATTGARAVALLRSGVNWMGDEIDCTAAELAADYTLYGTAGWEEVQIWDPTGLLYRRDLHTERGLSDSLVRLRWGGARHRDRYRWATWTGRLTVAGSAIDEVTPWAATHPEQIFERDRSDVTWRTQTFGSDIGVVVRLSDLANAQLRVDAAVDEDGHQVNLELSGTDLLSTGHREVAVGGLNLTLRVERVAEFADLPITVNGNLTIDLPVADTAVYLRARQTDGHQVWTSPLFISRTQAE
ncbi:DUF3604 domain-containing protein [Mycobacterium paraterrae]|uniref:DUF3604 domain-containing protein n=1 Tax=Mycobacterium paraterrae TaxID=577492 RepID=A0ABY3VPJ0_9MYCO|nr:DUF3604 domain-containing protein [Mycobacterium paraterrae]UMB71337.1 DUF3604 domain-containing protein [Mycobacterium paraterrae]